MHEVLFALGLAKHELGPETSLEISSTFGWHLRHLYNDAHRKLEQRMAIGGCITEEPSRPLDLSLCKDDDSLQRFVLRTSALIIMRFTAKLQGPIRYVSLKSKQRPCALQTICLYQNLIF